MRSPAVLTFSLCAACFGLGVVIEPELAATKVYARHEGSPVEVIFGDARALFAGQFYTKADVYFHSGYYPGIFDQASTNRETHLSTESEHDKHEEEANFLGEPLDFIDRFSRSFFPSRHTHLDEEGSHEHGTNCKHDHDTEAPAGKVREMLPWLRMTAELDPHRIETYTVGSYWLRTRMKKPREAEAFLRDGLKANPGNCAILFELGRIFHENQQDSHRARNVWEAALQRWNEMQDTAMDPDPLLLLQITWQLALLEDETGHPDKAIAYLKMARNVSPNPEAVEKRMEEMAAQAKPVHP